jgi:hypothetical protein
MQVLAAYDVADKNLCRLYISDRKEGRKIPVINAFDDTTPPKLIYSADRIPMKSVHAVTAPMTGAWKVFTTSPKELSSASTLADFTRKTTQMLCVRDSIMATNALRNSISLKRPLR